jgi:hypothetical protein
MSKAFDDCAQLSAAADELLSRSEELKRLRIVNPYEARKVAARIEEFEKRFSAFLAVTHEVPKLREDAEAMLVKFSRARERFGIANGGQVEILHTKLSKFLADTVEIPAQRDVAEDALLKFAAARSLLNGEAGN